MVRELLDKRGKPVIFHHHCEKEWEGRVMEHQQKKEFAAGILYSLYLKQGHCLHKYYAPSDDYPDFVIERDLKFTTNFTVVCVDDIDAPYSRDNSAAMRLFKMNGTYPVLVLVSMMCLETMDADRPLCGGYFTFKIRYESLLDNCMQIPLDKENLIHTFPKKRCDDTSDTAFALTDDIHFPKSAPIDERGTIAIGGDLSPERLIEAYSNGIFPCSAFRANILKWRCPRDRFVIFPDEVHISHSMKNIINRKEYIITYDQAFDQVINTCFLLHIRERYAWINQEMVEAYIKLNRMGQAHSVEVWKNDRLVGGLFGAVLKKVFFGQSMFSFEPNASKFTLLFIGNKLKKESGKFFDCLYESQHARAMGGRYITHEEYMTRLNDGQ